MKIIANSEIVFASHGSGLANCIALSNKATLIEVCPEKYYINKCNSTKVHFHLLALTVGCKYEFIQSNNDYTLSLMTLKNKFQKMGI